ncbi:MAG: hypothetical protein APR55_07115 [Methanolinea sp. SDB]|nr:MAG: hypothetical protein APR55_07115 [Methanolinea sp. SDB]
MIRIISKKDGFRRGGVAHPAKPKDYPDDFFDNEQLEALKNEPMLVVQELADPAGEEGPDSGKGKTKSGKKE